MPQQNLDFGTVADNDGETPYTAWPKVEANFTELYASAAAQTAALAAHEAASNPHPGYLTEAEADAMYADIAHTHTLDGLSDVVITAPSTGQVVKFNGTAWVNATDATGGGGGGGLSDGDYGDVTVSATGSVITIDNGAVTYAKMQNISATDKLLGRASSGAGNTEEIACTAAGRALLDDTSSAAQRATLGLSLPVDVSWYGAVAGSGSDQSVIFDNAATAAAAQAYKFIAIDAGTYTFTNDVDWSAIDGVILRGDVTFDFSTASSATGFPKTGHVNVSGPALVALPDLNADVVKGATQLVFASAPSIARGDRVVIYNPTNSSYHGSRTYYRAGEICRIGSLSSSTADLMGGLYAAYAAAAVDMYLLARKTFSIAGGKLTIIESANAAFAGKAGFFAERVCDSDFSAVRGTNSGYGAHVWSLCCGVYGVGYDLQQDRYTGNGTQYGIAMGNCQDITISGNFRGGRHAITMGGGDFAGAVPCRNIRVNGICENDKDAGAGIGAFNTHGNCEYVTFDGVARGGSNLGGDYITLRGEQHGHANQSGVVILLSEMYGCNYDFTNVRVFTAQDPQTVSRGIIDIGGNSVDVLDANTQRGGVLNFSGMVFDAPISRRFIVIRNRGYVGAEKIIVRCDSMLIKETSGASPLSIYIDAVSGNALDELHVNGYRTLTAMGITAAGTVKVRGWRQAGTATITPSTAASTAAVSVTFTPAAPKVPKVTVTPKAATGGGKRITPYAASVVAGSFSPSVATCDATNFSSTATVDVDWVAFVDEVP